MAVPYTFSSATGSIPLSQLDSNFATAITIGNTAVVLGDTITTVNNLSLANVAITSVSTAFPNGYLANSNVVLGTTTLTLGSNVTSVNGLTLSNVSLIGANVTISSVSITSANISGTANISDLVVIGNTSVGGNVSVTGNVTGAKGTFTSANVSGTANVQIIAVTQDASVAGNITATGNITGAKGTFTSANVSGIANVATLAVVANSTVGGNVSITGNISAANGTFTSANISGTANVSTLAVISNVTIGGNATVTGNVSMNVATITTANVSGTANVSTLVVTANQTSLGNISVTGNVSASSFTSTSTFGFKNRIINGAMVLAQRGTSAVTVNSNAGSNYYAVDRFFGQGQSTDGVFTMQQSSTAPAGFSNSIVITVTTADASLGATQVYQLVQPIEAYNTNDLAWGTASAATVTLSFWVRSSVTGTFGGALFNSAANRSYPFTYTISAANTFEQKTITIAGDTSGTWSGTNGVGIYVIFGLGVGSTYSGTAGAWAGTTYNSATGATNLMATNGATFYITGVQLEKGSTATSFDYRPYGTEFQLCQRYYEQWNVPATAYVANGFAYSSASVRTTLQFQVPKRAAVTSTFSGSVNFSNSGKSATITSFSFDGNSVNSTLMYNDAQTGFTLGQGLQIQVPGGSSATISFSAEL